MVMGRGEKEQQSKKDKTRKAKCWYLLNLCYKNMGVHYYSFVTFVIKKLLSSTEVTIKGREKSQFKEDI